MFQNIVSIILTGNASDYAAMSIAWTTQIERNHLIFSGPDHAEATKRIVEAGTFFVSILAADQTEVARYFGGRNAKPSALSEVLPVEVNDHLTIEGAVKSIRCEVVDAKHLNKQMIVFGKIIDQIDLNEQPQLVYNRPDYWADK